ncbi:MAG: hypothetical protein JWN66_4419 [Sphingomonas bacterium]|uniref:hypothetical protein n=1 Tax=Sphingomonas bacterium TaxID=1895847 RepID=UPI002619DB16|nr:hypothetical protein [Sphingomonas bacterium]MDB5707303.1 hypothetical protein [Sphingomonas bacterium]
MTGAGDGGPPRPHDHDTPPDSEGHGTGTIVPGSYVDNARGNDATTTASYDAPAKLMARAIALFPENATTPILMLKAGQNHPARDIAQGTGQQFGSYGLSGYPRRVSSYGSHALPPLIDARQDLSGKTWTRVSGTAWETEATLLTKPVFSYIETANGSKFMLYLDDGPHDPAPAGKSLTWRTNNADVAANDASVIAHRGSFGINIVGRTDGDIRLSGSASKSVRLIVNLPDGSNPNGKALKLCDAGGGALFYGGDHGHLRIIGGSTKDNVAFGTMGPTGAFPTFQSVEVIEPPCHGGVGPRIVIGTFKAHGRPIEGESAHARGRTFGGGYHVFTGNDYTERDMWAGRIDVANFTIGDYAHGGGNSGYRRDIQYGRSLITNCTTGIQRDGGPAPGVGFVVEGLYRYGGVDIVGGSQAFLMGDERVWEIHGGSFTPDNQAAVAVVFLGGSGNKFLLKDFVIDASAVSTVAPIFNTRTLYLWRPYYGTSGHAPPTLVLDNVQDVTRIDADTFKCTMYADSSSYPDASRAHLELRNGTTLGDLWTFPHWNSYPESLITEAGTTIGFGGKTRAQVAAAMAALGRHCSIDPGTKMVDHAGMVVDAPA